MLVFAIGFAVGGLATCLFIAVAPQRFMQVLSLVCDVWREARWFEKIGLVLLIAPIPGPVDEIVGFLVIRRIIKRRKSLVGGWLELPAKELA